MTPCPNPGCEPHGNPYKQVNLHYFYLEVLHIKLYYLTDLNELSLGIYENKQVYCPCQLSEFIVLALLFDLI